MNIVVAMKQIPEVQQIRIKDRKPIIEGVPLTFGNIDKNALEEAVRIKEAHQAQITVVCVGSDDLEDTVKEALAIGADEAKLVICQGELESITAASYIAAVVKGKNADMILFGEGSGDNYSSQVSSRVACILGLPQIGYANRIEVNDHSVIVTRSLEDGEEKLEAQMPAVVSVTADINKPRIPSVTQILRAGRKPKEIIKAQELGVDISKKTIETVSNIAPEIARRQIALKSVAELLAIINKEGF